MSDEKRYTSALLVEADDTVCTRIAGILRTADYLAETFGSMEAAAGLSAMELDSGECKPAEHRLCENTALEGIPLKELGEIDIEEVLQLTRGNKSEPARFLWINRASLCRRKS